MKVIHNTISAIALFFILIFLNGCSSKPLTLAPELQPYQYVIEDSKLFSQKFHLIAISPSFEVWNPNPILHLGFAVRNGSALETKLALRDFSFTLNGQPLAVQSFSQANQRTLAEHDRLIKIAQTKNEQQRFGAESAFGSDTIGSTDWDPVGMAMKNSFTKNSLEQQLKGIEVATKRKMERIDQLYRNGIEIPANKTYEGFIEAELPNKLKAGDKLDVVVNVEPDSHKFQLIFVEDPRA